MHASRRTVLSALAAGTAATLIPAAGAATGATRQDGSAARIEWTETQGAGYPYHVTGAVSDGAGGAVAVCNLGADSEASMATRLLSVGQDGSVEILATLGNPDYERRRYWYWDIAPAVDSGYVLCGFERQFSPYGNPEEFIPRLTYVQPNGTIGWTQTPEGTAAAFDIPEPVSVVRTGEQYRLTSRDWEGTVDTVLAAYTASGDRNWKRRYVPERDASANPVQLVATDDGVTLLAVRGMNEDGRPTEPVVVALAEDGTVDQRTALGGDANRRPRGIDAIGGRFLIVGDEPDGSGAASGGWAMTLSGHGGDAQLYGPGGDFGDALEGVAGSSLYGGWITGGWSPVNTGRLVAARDLTSPDVASSTDGTRRYADAVATGDGAAYVLGTTGGDTAELATTRLSTALDADQFSISVEPSDPDPGQAVSLSVDTGAYDQSLLDVGWTADGSELDAGFSGEASFSDAGEHQLVAAVSTIDGRSVSLERTVPVGGGGGSDGSDGSGGSGGDSDDGGGGGGGSPGFGVLAAGGGLLGGAALWQRLRDRNDDN